MTNVIRARTIRAVVSVTLAFMAACGGDADPVAVDDPINLDLDGDGFANAIDVCPNEAETVNSWLDDDGCPDSTTEFYEQIRESAEVYWGAVFDAGALTYTPISIFQAYQVSASTPCGETQHAAYCPLDLGVYYSQPFLDSFLQGVGDAGAAFVIAHEIGHHIGFSLGWFKSEWSEAFPQIPHTVISAKETELMADCFSGDWMGWVDAQGLLEVGDLDEALVAILNVADPDDTWFDPTAHGTDVQRVAAFAIGFDEGAAACVSPEFFDLFPSPPSS